MRQVRTIGDVEKDEETDQHRRYRLGDEHPLPAGQPRQTVQSQQSGRHRRADRHRERQRHHETRHDAGAMPIREPIGEEQDHARKQSGLGEAEQKTHDQKTPRPDAKRSGARQHAPAHHDAGDPHPRADLFQDNVARYFEQEIAPEESPRRHAVGGGVEAQILVHGQRGKADIDAVEIAEKISKNGERQQPPIDLAHGRAFDGRTRGCQINGYHGSLPRSCNFYFLLLAQHRLLATGQQQRTDWTERPTSERVEAS